MQLYFALKGQMYNLPIYKIADIFVEMSPAYKETQHWYKPYLEDDNTQPDAQIIATEEEINYYVTKGVDITPPVSENMVLFRKFNMILTRFNGSYIHSSAVLFDGKVYLFSADSGVGKSTLTERICRLYPDKAVVINDDKPSFRIKDGKCYVYGTPFAGGTDKHVNICAELGGIVFLERSDANSIRRISASEAIPLLYKQARLANHPTIYDRLLSMISFIIENYPFYLMNCTNSDSAVSVALEVTKADLHTKI